MEQDHVHQLKPGDTQHFEDAEQDTDLNVNRKRQRERTKSLADNVDSPGETCYLYEVLDLLHGFSDTPPPSVSHWTTFRNDQIVREYFKIKRRLVSPDDLVLRYFWAAQTKLYDNWQKTSEIQTILNFMGESTAKVNVSETELFLPAEISPDYNRLVISETIWNEGRTILRSNNRQRELVQLTIDNRDSVQEIAIQLRGHVAQWMKLLSEVVKLSPDTVPEAAYEELFLRYLEQFNLRCLRGSFLGKLSIPYRGDKSVTSVPDILFSMDDRKSQYCGVVEVKRMTEDPAFKHAFNEIPKQGILGHTSEECRPTKKKCVNFGSEVATKTISEEYEDPEDRDNTMHGSPLPEPLEQLIKIFFGQLFGSVLALECEQPSAEARRLGIGVVGFRVIFFAFYAKPGTAFKDIPSDVHNRMEVQVTRPLSMLIAADRKEIAKIVLHIADRDILQL